MKYEYILFDADGTLFNFKKSEKYSFEQVCRSFGIEYSDKMYADYHVINDNLWKDLENGLITKPELLVERFRRLSKKYSITVSPEELNKLYLQTLGTCHFLLDGTLEICKRLYGRVKMYIVTNGEATVQKNRYESSEIREYFEDVFISGKIGHEKPKKEYFDAVFSKIPDIDLKKTLIVGDSLTSDIRGGNNAGIDTCYFNPEHDSNYRGIPFSYEIDNILDVERIIFDE